MRSRAASIVVVSLLVVWPVAGSPVETCPIPEPQFSRAAANQGVVGVVERETLASNPFPWGGSISVATRIWGGIRTDRWKVSDRNLTGCPNNPSSPTGSIEYDFRGAEAEWGGQRGAITRQSALSAEEALLLETRFGPPESIPNSGVDRVMAVIRVWGLEMALVFAGLVLALVRTLRSRRRKRLDRHIF